MLVDDVTVTLKAGDGGKGAVAFQKVRLMQGPTGGDGGRGANIYFEGVADVNALGFYASKRNIVGENGYNGRGQFVDGRAGHDLFMRVPVGTIVTNTETGFKREITQVGEQLLAAGGGKGGRGNFKFRSSTNTTPMESEEGKQGDTTTYRLELRLIADVGLVGLPNAGKSSLLNALTAAKSRVANYAFTTLEPHLGSHYGVIIADIPGLIEGASEGKGLGDKFLRHIERTQTLFHLVSAESDDVVRDYQTIRSELEAYDTELGKKKEYVFLTKSDAVTADVLAERIASLKKIGVHATPISILDDESLAAVKTILNALKR
ncbi:MAG TPA: GTPase ObgE [Candidatus Paceibacterota bacterium]|nr:GTPase ObgE [Candidatus Paceibacterota bacterium]